MKQRLIIVLIIIFTLSNYNAFAQSNVWKLSQSTNLISLWDVVMLDKQKAVAVTWEEKVANGVKTSSAKIISTFDGGKTWQESLSEVNRGAPAIDKLNDNDVVVVGGANNYLSCWKSNNGISSFTSMMSDNAYIQGKPSFWSVDFVNSSIGYGGTASGYILKTTNGGNSWNYLTHNFGKGCIVTMSFLDENNGFVAHSNADYDQYQGKKLYKTTNGGNSWKEVLSVDVIREVLYLDKDNVFCVGSVSAQPKIWKSSDGGMTWKIVFESNPEVYWMNGISFTKNKYIGYAVGGQGDSGHGAIFRTIDGGETWEMELGNLPSDLVKVSFDEETNGIAVGENGMIYYCEREVEPPFTPGLKLNDTIADLSFGDIGDTIYTTVILKAKNPAGITINEISEGEPDFSKKGFALQFNNLNLPKTLGIGEYFEFKVKLTNTKEGVYESFVKIKSNDAKNPNYLLKIVGEIMLPVLPTLKVSLNQFEFNDIEPNTTKDINFKIHSATPFGLTVQNMKIENDPNKFFNIKSSEILPYEMYDVDSFNVTLSFTPKTKNNINTFLVITSNDSKKPTFKVPISVVYNTASAPALSLSKDTLNFGEISDIKKKISLIVKNKSQKEIMLESVSISNNTDNLFNSSSSKPMPTKLMANDSLILDISISNLSIGQHERILTITTNELQNNTYKVPLKANIISTSIEEENSMNGLSFISINKDKSINVTSNYLGPQNYNLYIFDINGKQLSNKNGILHNGNNTIDTGIINMMDGVYVYILEANEKIVSKKYTHLNK